MTTALAVPDLPTLTMTCRFCRSTSGELVLDMGHQPACDYFPLADDPSEDPVHPVRLWLCAGCQLAQLIEDPTLPDEVRGVEPLALVRQAEAAVALVATAGLLPKGGAVIEYGSPHGGSWLHLLAGRGLKTPSDGPVDVVLDCFGLMHEADLRDALMRRASELVDDGVLLVQFHSLAAVVEQGQWNAVRHGHPVYLSTPAMVGMLAAIGLTTVRAWRFELYGGTVLLAARRGGATDSGIESLLAAERAVGVEDPVVLRNLQREAVDTAGSLRRWLTEARDDGRRVLGYGAASRAVPLLNHARIGPDLLPAVADASPPKHGRRIPGVGIPIVRPADIVARCPDEVVLFVPDLLDEVRDRLPQIESGGGQWILLEPRPRAVPRRM